ncbi:ATP-binding protein [Candidatus Micrarchaeota archaeon]|nr:ATP-binding protein [Candidatus Micrarchaeota archaeon]
MQAMGLMSTDIAIRLPLIHPPEPRKEHLLSNPTDSIFLGKTKWLSTPVFWDYRRLINPHIAIVGITGSGKSYLVKTFITRSSIVWDTNALILDWTGEYEKWVRQAGGKVIDLSKEHLNLLDLVGMGSGERTKQIISALDILADLQNFPKEREEIESALEKVYKHKKSPELKDLLSILKEPRAVRMIKRLTLQGSDFFSGKSTLTFSSLLTSGLVCVNLRSLPSEELRSLAALTILQFTKEMMRRQKLQEEKGIKLFVVLDEAWKIASDERSEVLTIIREGRKYNFALIVSSQNPTDVHKTILSNSGTLFIMRLVLREFRKYVQESLNYSDYVDSEISKFSVGDAALHMIFSGQQAKSSTFIMQKIDGEEPLFVFRIKGESMEIEMEREQFMRALYELGVNDEQMAKVKDRFEKAEGTLSGTKLIEMLENFGYSKAAILAFMRKLGVPEKGLIDMFALARRKRASRGMVDAVLED